MPTSHFSFRALPCFGQVQTLWDEGTYLTTRTEQAYTIVLYHMPANFFVELSFNPIANELVERVRTFTNMTYLEDYASSIDPHDLPPGVK